MKKKTVVTILVIPPVIFAAAFLFVLYEGPRMTVQHHLRDFQMIMPAAPAGVVPVTQVDALPTPAQAGAVKNPLQNTPQTLTAARVYYSYYCIFCHGDNGAGDGPVGHSYVPRPADLRTGRVGAMSDGALLRAMLTGVGHEPVLERVVPPEHRWYLVLFLRSLPRATSTIPQEKATQ